MKATFCKTKTGNGFKLAIDDKWLYVGKDALLAVVRNEATSCRFSTMDEPDSTKKESVESKEGSSSDGSSALSNFSQTNTKWE